MPLTDTERARLRALWRQLANAALRRDAAELEALSPRALDWASPLDGKGASYVLFGLARWARGFAKATQAERAAFGPAMVTGAALALELLGAERPPPALPFRRDLDG